MTKRVWIIYDERAHTCDPFDASVLDTADSEKEARHCVAHYYPGAAVFVYDLIEHSDGVESAENGVKA